MNFLYRKCPVCQYEQAYDYMQEMFKIIYNTKSSRSMQFFRMVKAMAHFAQLHST